ncbi:glycosyltransferase [Catenovulum agarivorans]|uniref:glycosyltransferase n=1 Tax=Catenovulum agarivorans TaxID=1172192 RepID=UPI000319FA85|nr:glycosyltransferase [Catenovulum agarivorans]
MIFLTVGTQLPFDRLVECVDQLCGKYPDLSVFGQIGESKYQPKNFDYQTSLSIQEFNKRFCSAQLIISHAGMGSIITALSNNKPILMMPRETQFAEHRNDHQLGTAKNFSAKQGCFVFKSFAELELHYKNIQRGKAKTSQVSKYAPEQMITNLKQIIA